MLWAHGACRAAVFGIWEIMKVLEAFEEAFNDCHAPAFTFAVSLQMRIPRLGQMAAIGRGAGSRVATHSLEWSLPQFSCWP